MNIVIKFEMCNKRDACDMCCESQNIEQKFGEKCSKLIQNLLLFQFALIVVSLVKTNLLKVFSRLSIEFLDCFEFKSFSMM